MARVRPVGCHPAGLTGRSVELTGPRRTAGSGSGSEHVPKNQAGQDPLNFPIKINNQLASVLSMVGNGDGRPTTQAPIILAELSAELKTYTDKLALLLGKDLPAINVELARLGLPPITK